MFIEGLRFFGYGVNQKAPNPENCRRLGRTQGGILQERGAKTLALPAVIDGETTKHRNRYWIGHIAPDGSRRVGEI